MPNSTSIFNEFNQRLYFKNAASIAEPLEIIRAQDSSQQVVHANFETSHNEQKSNNQLTINDGLFPRDLNIEEQPLAIRAYYYHKARAGALSFQTELKYKRPNWSFFLKVCSALCGLGAAIKAFNGTNGFFKEQWNKEAGIIFGAISALPAVFFYFASLDRISKKAAKKIVPVDRQFNFENLPNQGFERPFPAYIHEDYTIQKASDLLLGLGYAMANLGMVLMSMPKMIEKNLGAQIFFTTATVFTNLAVGIDKSHKVTDDFIEGFINQFMASDLAAKAHVELASHALHHFEEFHENASEDDQNKIHDALKQEIEQCSDAFDIFAIIHKHIKDAQIAKDNTVQVNRNNIGDDYALLEQGLLYNQQLCDAKENAFHYRYSFKKLNIKHYSLKAFSLSVAVAAVASNVGGINHMLEEECGWTNSAQWAVTARYILGVIGSLAAIGLNKHDTDRWAEQIENHHANKMNINISGHERSSAWCDPFAYVGYLISALGATAGVYFTQQSNSDTQFGPILSWYCVVSTAILMTSTKGKPSGALLKNGVHWLIDSARVCVKPKIKLRVLNKELVTFQEEHIEKLLEKMGHLVEEYNILLKKCSGEQQQLLDLAPISVSRYCAQVNEQIQMCSGSEAPREAIIDLLTKHLKQISLKVDTIYYAKPIIQGDYLVDEGARCCLQP